MELLAELAVVVRDFGQLLRVEVEGVPSREAARLNAAPGPAAGGAVALGYQQLLHVERAGGT